MPTDPSENLEVEDLDSTDDVKGGAGRVRFETPPAMEHNHPTGTMDRPRRRPIVDIDKSSSPRDK